MRCKNIQDAAESRAWEVLNLHFCLPDERQETRRLIYRSDPNLRRLQYDGWPSFNLRWHARSQFSPEDEIDQRDRPMNFDLAEAAMAYILEAIETRPERRHLIREVYTQCSKGSSLLSGSIGHELPDSDSTSA